MPAATAIATMPPNRKQIKTALSSIGLKKIDNDVLSKCVALASTLHLSAHQMAEIWEVYSMNKPNVNISELPPSQFDGYKNELIKSSNVVDVALATSSPNTKTAATLATTRVSSNAVTPTSSAKKSGASSGTTTSATTPMIDHVVSSITRPTPTKVKTYQERTNVGQVVASYTPSTSTTTSNNNTSPEDDSTTVRCVVTTDGTVYIPNNDSTNNTSDKADNAMMVDDDNDNTASSSDTILVGKYNITQPYRHMFTTMDERATQLENHLVRMKQQLIDEYQIRTTTNGGGNGGNTTDGDDDIMMNDVFGGDDDDDIERIMMEIDDNIASGGGVSGAATATTTSPSTTTNSNTKSQTSKSSSSFFTSTLGEVHVPRQDLVTVVGRICNEAHEGRLNSTSVVLEGSRSTSGGARINVDLDVLLKNQPPNDNNNNTPSEGYSLFPGQIVAMEGMNVTGRKLRVERLVEGTPAPTPTSRVGDLKQLWTNGNTTNGANASAKPIKIMTACGPFTTSDNLQYEPLIDFLNEVLDGGSSSGGSNNNGITTSGPADVVILMGPFVDVQHESIKSGNVVLETETEEGSIQQKVVSYETLFMEKITSVIEEVLFSNSTEDDDNLLKTQFILVPSLDDATAHWVYPQPPLQDRLAKGGKRLSNVPGADDSVVGSLGLYQLDQLAKDTHGRRRVHCMSNPCTFQINDVVFGVTSTDVIFQMSVEETSANLPTGSRIRRIAQHMVQQQSYYPMFPPAKSVNMDLKQQDGWRMPVKADVLIAPTKLTPFCSPIMGDNNGGDTIVINPGHLTKRTTGGTYAIMDLHPPSPSVMDENLPDTQRVPHNVQDRLHVQVKRI